MSGIDDPRTVRATAELALAVVAAAIIAVVIVLAQVTLPFNVTLQIPG